MSSGKPFISFRTVRITILLVILFFVGTDTWLRKLRVSDWSQSLWVVLYPINGDGSALSSDYIRSLQEADFDGIEIFMASEAARHGLALPVPIKIKLAPEVSTHPPVLPTTGAALEVIWWSLKMRYWAMQSDTFEGPGADIQIFVRYFDPATHQQLEHSLGLEKGLLGLANVFADGRQRGQNQIVIAHEMLHTLGASDKYHAKSGQPRYPDGFASPDKTPLFPQSHAELMAGRIAITETEAIIPQHFKEVIIGALTAREIRWLE